MKYLKTFEQKSITELDYSYQSLTSLPALPDSLKYLYCWDNQLPYTNLYSYKEWKKENKDLIKLVGHEDAHTIGDMTDKYNL